MPKIYIEYEDGHDHGGGITPGQENEPWPSYEDAYRFFTVIRATKSLPSSPYYESFDWSGEIPRQVCVVVARFYDGNTFGCTHGYGTIVGVHATEEEAELQISSIIDGYFKGFKPWDGYFAGLECVFYNLLEVQDE